MSTVPNLSIFFKLLATRLIVVRWKPGTGLIVVRWKPGPHMDITIKNMQQYTDTCFTFSSLTAPFDTLQC